jgi:threonine aldolase
MRQAGVLAAAGLISLEKMPLRLHEDHANAGLLAEGLAAIPGVRVSPVQTNIVIFDVSGLGLSGTEMSARLTHRGVLANAVGPTWLRMVTHYDVTTAMCSHAVEAVRDIAVKYAAAAEV